MVEGDRDLNQALQKFALGFRGVTPDVFQNFVRVEELLLVEKVDTVAISRSVCVGICHDVRDFIVNERAGPAQLAVFDAEPCAALITKGCVHRHCELVRVATMMSGSCPRCSGRRVFARGVCFVRDCPSSSFLFVFGDSASRVPMSRERAMSYQNRRRAIQFLFIGMTLLAVALWAAPSMLAQSLISGDIAGPRSVTPRGQ